MYALGISLLMNRAEKIISEMFICKDLYKSVKKRWQGESIFEESFVLLEVSYHEKLSVGRPLA